jgi:hypothetical protein
MSDFLVTNGCGSLARTRYAPQSVPRLSLRRWSLALLLLGLPTAILQRIDVIIGSALMSCCSHSAHQIIFLRVDLGSRSNDETLAGSRLGTHDPRLGLAVAFIDCKARPRRKAAHGPPSLPIIRCLTTITLINVILIWQWVILDDRIENPNPFFKASSVIFGDV